MTEAYVIRNQLGHYWGKSKAWVDGSQPRLVLRTKHRDEAVNTLFELSSKDFELRGDVIAVELSERGEPMIEPSQNPLPLEPETQDPTHSNDLEAGPVAESAPADDSTAEETETAQTAS